jgi:hypothetical protein
MIISNPLSYLRSATLIFVLFLCLAFPGFATARNVTLQWDHSIDYPYIQSYRVYYYTTSHVKDFLIPDDRATSCTVEFSPPPPPLPLPPPPPCSVEQGPITIDKQNTQITLTLPESSKYYYFVVSSVDTRGLEGETTNEISDPLVRLSVVKEGTGRGTVTGSPSGINSDINCGTGCSSDNADYAHGATVTLTAVANPGQTFIGWSGCDSVDPQQKCTVTMGLARSVRANFIPFLRLSVAKQGAGAGTISISPPGINCETACSEDYSINTIVTLTATPHAKNTFAGWSGGGCPAKGPCAVKMDDAKNTTAKFVMTGDVNLSGVVNLADAILVLQVMSRALPAGIDGAVDVNNDDKLGLADAIYILQEIAGLR